MKLDEKYFVPFIGGLAVISALLIVYFTVHNKRGQEQRFRTEVTKQDSLKTKFMPLVNGKDSLRVASFSNKFVILDFWATWTSSFSTQAHKQLDALKRRYPDRLEILAAVVEDKPRDVQKYISRHSYSFHYVDGTRVFNAFHLPGVPTQLVYSPGGKLQSIFTGSTSSARMDSLNNLLSRY